MGNYWQLYSDKVRAAEDKKHFESDWESNIDGHLMNATGKFLGEGKYDVEGFKEYMRAVFGRPFVRKKQIGDWFGRLSGKLEGDEDVREGVLRELLEELEMDLPYE